MDRPKVWITTQRHFPSLTDFSILEWLAYTGGYVHYQGIYRGVRNGSGGVAKHNSIETLINKDLVEERGREHPTTWEIRITPKGKKMLELCKKTSVIFQEIEDSFKELGW